MEEQQTLELKPLSSANRRRPGTSPISRNRESDLQDRNRPATAAYIHGNSNPQTPTVPAAQTSRQEEASALSEGTATGSSTFSLPVLSSEPVSTVTLLEDGNMLTELLPTARMQPPDYEDSPPEYSLAQEKIQNLLYLTEGEMDFDSDKELPDIFAQVDQLEKYADIEVLKGRLEDDGLKPYIPRFSHDMRKESLLVGKMSREEIEEEERKLQLEHLAYQEQEAVKQLERQRQITALKEVAKKEINKTTKRRRRALKKKEAQVVQSSTIQRRELYSAFNTAQKQMIRALKARKAEVKTLYGDLQRANGCYGGVRGRRWKVDWNRAPQPVQIKLKSLRGVRDKLPGSHYILLVSLYDRLGGHVLRWSRLRGQQWAASTLPVEHGGHYYNTEIKLDQSVYTVLPPRVTVKPSMVLLFEVWLLRGVVSPTDRVVGWGVFPVCDAGFRIIEGKYKCPLLRGPVDPVVTKHSQIETLMASDLENWLCNLYFEVVKLPRYLSGMHEYEVELKFSSALLGLPDRTHDDFSHDDITPDKDMSYGDSADVHKLIESPSTLMSTANEEASKALRGIPPGFARRSGSSEPLESRMSRKLHSTQVGDSDSDSCCGEGQREDGEFTLVDNQPGLYYKVHTFNPLEEKQAKAATMYPHTRLLQERGHGQQQRRALSEEEELQQYSVAVKKPFSDCIKKKRRINERVQYVGRQLLSEFGPWQWRSLEFWSTLVILILCWWIRLYLHYVAQYSFLRAIRIPVNRFEFFPHTVILNYQSSLLFTRETIAIVLLGPIFNMLIFNLLILLSWLIQRLFGSFPDIGSQFILAFGVQALLDPYWLFIVDMALLRFQAPRPEMQTADVTKLYWHFDRLEGNGVVGIFLLVFLYLFISFLTLACLYMFFLRVHKNGQLIDIYHRLWSPEEHFFVPRDMEVSNHELGWVCRKAEQWRGAEGERRKVAVHDYCEISSVKGGNSARRRQVTTHVSIHALHLDDLGGLRELYRHFLRLEDGSIIEVFGELSNIPGISPNLKNALTSQGHSHSDTTESITSSQHSADTHHTVHSSHQHTHDPPSHNRKETILDDESENSSPTEESATIVDMDETDALGANTRTSMPLEKVYDIGASYYPSTDTVYGPRSPSTELMDKSGMDTAMDGCLIMLNTSTVIEVESCDESTEKHLKINCQQDNSCS